MLQTGKAPTAKSLSVAVTDCDDRVSARNDAKHGGVVSSALTLMPPSKKLNCGKVPDGPVFGVYAHGAAVGIAFEMAQARSSVFVPHFAPFSVRRSCREPPFWSPPVPTHSSTWIVAVAPPFVRFASTNMSPTTWVPLNDPFAVVVMLFWKNQNPSWASPSFANRSAPK